MSDYLENILIKADSRIDFLAYTIQQVLRISRNNVVLTKLFAPTSETPGFASVPIMIEDDAPRPESIQTAEFRIRHIDAERSIAALSLDRAAIEKSGKLTVGDLLQSLPSIVGGASQASRNSSQGSGSAFVALRGLGQRRPLLLIDGQRVSSNDTDAVPSNRVERIDVLPYGACAVYGAEAIGGVVNFIMRSDFRYAGPGMDHEIPDQTVMPQERSIAAFADIFHGDDNPAQFAAAPDRKQPVRDDRPTIKRDSRADFSVSHFARCASTAGALDKMTSAAA